jgi:glycosyltransferase involved in cell wall biosynthesis
MHILFFADHHPDSLGGIQTSLMLHKKYLERLGHKVTIVASLRYRRKKTQGLIEVPALPLPPTGAYSIQPSLHLAFRKAEKALSELAEPVDVVHIWADTWQAMVGVAYAKAHNLPMVQTIHTNLQTGFEHNIGKIGTRSAAQLLNRWASSFLDQPRPKNINTIWAYQEQISRNCKYVSSPSHHFNQELIKQGVVKDPLLFPNGVDDDIVEGVTHKWTPATNRPVKIIWAGRLSSEKRITEFLGAFAMANLENVTLDIYGIGQLEARVRLAIKQYGLSKVAHLRGRLPHKQLVATFATADLVCQTSVGFETQGMTVYESISVGTPVFVADPKIAGELPKENVWLSKKPDVDSMAVGLREAVADIRAGRAKRADDTGEWSVLQSKLTDRWLKLYDKAIKESAPKAK